MYNYELTMAVYMCPAGIYLLKVNNKNTRTRWSKTGINFLDVTVPIAESIIENDQYVKPTDIHWYLLSSPCHLLYWQRVYNTSRHYSLAESGRIINCLIKDAMT